MHPLSVRLPDDVTKVLDMVRDGDAIRHGRPRGAGQVICNETEISLEHLRLRAPGICASAETVNENERLTLSAQLLDKQSFRRRRFQCALSLQLPVLVSIFEIHTSQCVLDPADALNFALHDIPL